MGDLLDLAIGTKPGSCCVIMYWHRATSQVSQCRALNFHQAFWDRFIPWRYHSYMSSLDGQSPWRDLVNRLDEQTWKNYVRLNISLPLQEPALDNVDWMDELRKNVHLQVWPQGAHNFTSHFKLPLWHDVVPRSAAGYIAAGYITAVVRSTVVVMIVAAILRSKDLSRKMQNMSERIGSTTSNDTPTSVGLQVWSACVTPAYTLWKILRHSLV